MEYLMGRVATVYIQYSKYEFCIQMTDINPDEAEFLRETVAEFSQRTVQDPIYETGSSSTFSDTDRDIIFLVYKRHDINNPYRLMFNSAVNPEYVKKERTTLIYIHGWKASDRFIDSLKNGYFQFRLF